MQRVLPNMYRPKPFVKWVGGKTQLLLEFKKLYPKHYGSYFESFLGSGAVFFNIRPKEAFLNDANRILISTYKYIKRGPDKLISQLSKLQDDYYKMDEVEREEFYYMIRNKFNNLPDKSLKKSACLIFLNKTCYNGMYRENSKGKFNVPFGKYKKPKILNEDNLLAVSALLENVKLDDVDFEKAVKKAKKGDFVYFDPPYYPLSSTSNFTGYSGNNFSESEQKRLKKIFADLDKRGCFVMLSNSYTNFIRDLYKEYKQIAVMANRAINCKATGRGKIKELVILNY